jgi:predicted dehydrogenase
MSTLNVALVGCGDIAVRQHLPTIAEDKSARLIAVCDQNLVAAQNAAREFDVTIATDNANEILTRADVEAVVIATPPWATPHLVIQALRAGKDVLSEKPMAVTVGEAEEVARVERETKQLVQIGFTYRHGPLMDALQNWIREGRLGSPLIIRIGVFDEVYEPQRNLQHYARIMATLKHGPPCLHDGAHCADHLHFLTGSSATRVHAFGIKTREEFPAPNYNCAWIEFENGDAARLEIGWFLPQLPKGEFQICGPRGLALLDIQNRQAVLQCDDGEDKMELDDDWVASCFRAQWRKFRAAIETRSTPVPGTREGIASLQLTKVMEQSIAEGREIKL